MACTTNLNLPDFWQQWVLALASLPTHRCRRPDAGWEAGISLDSPLYHPGVTVARPSNL